MSEEMLDRPEMYKFHVAVRSYVHMSNDMKSGLAELLYQIMVSNMPMHTMVYSQGYNLVENPRLPCPHVNGAVYKAEFDNYYCVDCNQGMGTVYYKAMKASKRTIKELEAEIRVLKTEIQTHADGE